VKKRYTGLNDKRHYCGKLAPNLFFVLEVLATLEIAYVINQVLAYMGVDSTHIVVLLILFLGAVLAIGKFWEDRRRVLNRQKGRCPEED
jgi:UPF0716 family protein affecting phage T7 exclusion